MFWHKVAMAVVLTNKKEWIVFCVINNTANNVVALDLIFHSTMVIWVRTSK